MSEPQLTRRGAIVALISLTAGCKFYSDPAPVVIGGAAVSADESIMTALRASSEHRRFVAALEASEVADLLEDIGPFTVFAPTDAAFAIVRPKSAAKQIADDPGALKQALLNHILPARLTTEDFFAALPQLNGSTKVFAMNNEFVRISGDEAKYRVLDMRKRTATIIIPDAIVANGIIHVIDSVLLPREESFVSP